MSILTEFETQTPDAEPGDSQVIEGRSQWQLTWRRLLHDKMAIASMIVIVVIALLASLSAGSGVTFLIATHDARVIAHSRRRIEMIDGRITADDRSAAPIPA